MAKRMFDLYEDVKIPLSYLEIRIPLDLFIPSDVTIYAKDPLNQYVKGKITFIKIREGYTYNADITKSNGTLWLKIEDIPPQMTDLLKLYHLDDWT